jgi:uncharacterized membrane protein
MSRRTLGFAVLAVGVIVVVVSALADQIGIGRGDAFGWNQIVGVIVGAVIAVVGVIVASRGEKPAPGLDAEE